MKVAGHINAWLFCAREKIIAKKLATYYAAYYICVTINHKNNFMKRIFTTDRIVKTIVISLPIILLAVYFFGQWYKR